ncbi:MAG: TPM domain-containing protein [Limisphaerales bacterium]
MKHQHFLSQIDEKRIVSTVHEAEQKTSGEIRVFVSHKHVEDPLATAQKEFVRLGMHQTREQNGVLIFVAPRTHKFAVIGDAGVHARCGAAFWRQVADEMTVHFKKAEFTQGIVHGVHKAGELLAQHFPHRPDDRNELPDDIAHD